MAAIIHALDKHTMQQVGEKGNVEHTWSFDIDEKIPQFFFQLVRSDDHTNLKRQLRQILLHFRDREAECIVQMCTMYKLIGQTRDIVAGKGEQQLSFMLLWGWNEFYPSLVEKAFEHFVLLKCHYSLHPYGSWKDIKYWCQYVYERSKDKNHPLIHHALDFAIRQLLFDEARYELWYEKKKGKPILSLCGKWLPREKSKYGWVFRLIAEKMYGHFQDTASTATSKKKAILKGRIMLKKLLVKLNRYLDTAQIKMCGEHWSQLNFNNITSQTLRRNKLAIMNTTKKGEQRSEKTDRIACSQKYTNHLALAKADPAHHKIHGKRCGVYELVKDALEAHNITNMAKRAEACETVNLQWENNRLNNKGLEKTLIVSMVDTSSSMARDDCTPLFNAIGLGIRTSELTHPAFKHRCLTFNVTPHWVNFEGCPDFVTKVLKVKAAKWGNTTNFYKALHLILSCILMNEIPPAEVEGMVLAVFSDMQIDARWCAKESMSFATLFEEITNMYAEAGRASTFRTPYKPPHILFWNLRQTTGFPVLSTQPNVTYLSGYNSTLLNVFCNKGVTALKECTPRKILTDLLDNPRYEIMEETLIAQFA